MEATPLHSFYHIHVHATKSARAYDLPNIPAERLQKNINKLQGAGLDIEVRSGGVMQPAAPTLKTVEAWVDKPKAATPKRLKKIEPEIVPPVAENPVKAKKERYIQKGTLPANSRAVIDLTTGMYYPTVSHISNVLNLHVSSIGKRFDRQKGKVVTVKGHRLREATEQEKSKSAYIPLREQL